jgi:hypothetical protein
MLAPREALEARKLPAPFPLIEESNPYQAVVTDVSPLPSLRARSARLAINWGV